MAFDRMQLEAAVGRNAAYYLRRFEAIESGRLIGWNWPAFFVSTAWFSYRGMGGWAGLNFIAPWLTLMLIAFTSMTAVIFGMILLFAYPVVFFILVPMYADALYYRKLKQQLASSQVGEGRPSSPTRPFPAAVVGFISFVFPLAVLAVVIPSYGHYTPRAQVGEAIALMSGARTSLAEHFADKGKWPDNLKQVAENVSGRYTDRIEITSGAGAASGAVVITATMKPSGVHSSVAGKTTQYRSEDGGKTWICSRGTVNGVEDKYLPASCR